MKRRVIWAVAIFMTLSTFPNFAHAAERKFQAEGCHSKVSATLQLKDGTAWKDVIAAQGWELVASCPAATPYEPWAMADIAIGTIIRWHIYAPGAWDFYSAATQVQEVFDPNSFTPVTAQAEIKLSDYPFVAALARASILADNPVAPTTQKITYQFESGVPIENQNIIKEGAVNFINHFGNILDYSSTTIGFIAYKTLPGGLALAKAWDPSDSELQADMERTFPTKPDPEKFPTQGMGGFSVGYKRLVVIGAPYFKASDPTIPTFPSDPLVATHELTHELQASINKGSLMRNPVWLTEGGAQVIGAAMSVYQGKDYWAIAGRNSWSNRIPANRTVADLKIMEGETSSLSNSNQNLSEYTTGAALTEYLIAWGGFNNSLLVHKIAFKIQNPDKMSGFRQAFKIVYGQSLDDFYVQSLPYINFVSANWKSTYATSPEALAFITDRLAAVKIAAEKSISDAKAAADKAAADKAAADKAAADKVAADKAAADKAAADKVAADKAAADKAAAEKLISDAKAAADKVAAEKLISDAKAAADKVAADKAVVVKKLTITCVKGKTVKKITAVKPTCPSGYRKTA